MEMTCVSPGERDSAGVKIVLSDNADEKRATLLIGVFL